MSAIRYIARGSCLITLIALLAGCVVVPAHGGYHEGYYDHSHHRWWHNNGWHDCDHDDSHCR